MERNTEQTMDKERKLWTGGVAQCTVCTSPGFTTKKKRGNF
jgi:hypothetical protein